MPDQKDGADVNLFDLVRRKGRAVEVVTGAISPQIYSYSGYKMNAVKLGAGTVLRVKHADEFTVLKTFPRFPGWKIVSDGGVVQKLLGKKKPVGFSIDLECHENTENRKILFSTQWGKNTNKTAREVQFNWPVDMCLSGGYNLVISNHSEKDIVVMCAHAFNPRQKITPLLKGKGVEVGPGLNPHVLPTSDVDVQYVESMPAEEWLALYKKRDQPSRIGTENLWSKYIVADAQALNSIANNSLDFIFSNHVFEHLMNPVQVLRNWCSKLKPEGVIVGVIPDCRYTFDLRQSPSTVAEWNEEYKNTINDIGMNKYEAWCKYTAPYNTPQSLVERNYSIHVHYYTPESFSSLILLLIDAGLFTCAFYNTSPNNKDFGFVLFKTIKSK